MNKKNKKISQAQSDYYAWQDAVADRPANRYFSANGISQSWLYYDNFKTFGHAKRFSEHPITNKKDQKTFRKFCNQWIIHKGAVDTKQLTSIEKMLKYYARKEQNAHNKQKRLAVRAKQLRPNSITE